MADRLPSSLTGLVVVRGAGSRPAQWRLPRRTTASVGRRERHALPLAPEWVPRDLVTFEPVEQGWLATNRSRTDVRLENEWVRGGSAEFRGGAAVVLQRGSHRLTWRGLEHPVAVSVTVRTRTLADQHLAYAVDGTLADEPAAVVGREASMSAAVRYRLAVLFRHLLEGSPPPPDVVRRRAVALGMGEEALALLAERQRRRLNVARGLRLQDLEELGAHLVGSGALTVADLDP